MKKKTNVWLAKNLVFLLWFYFHFDYFILNLQVFKYKTNECIRMLCCMHVVRIYEIYLNSPRSNFHRVQFMSLCLPPRLVLTNFMSKIILIQIQCFNVNIN